MSSLDYTRQMRIFNPLNQKSKIHIIGGGSTGSFICLNLAKLGFESIKVTDFDKVEEVNIPNQFYRNKDVGEFKVVALKEIVSEFTGTEIIAENKLIDEDYEFDLDSNTIIIFCLDNMETRKLIYDKVKDFGIKIIDTRMGGEGFQIYAIDLLDEDNKRFESALNGETAETICGEKSVIYTILSIASETCNIVKRIDKGETYPRVVKREMTSWNIVGGIK